MEVLDHKALLELLALPVLKDLKESEDFLELLGHKDPQVQMEIRDLLDLQALQELMEPVSPEVHIVLVLVL